MPVDKMFVPHKAIQVNWWIELVTVSLQPFSVFENSKISKHIRYDPISLKTLKKYMSSLTKKVDSNIARILRDTFALIFDGWTNEDTHFVAIFEFFFVRFRMDSLRFF